MGYMTKESIMKRLREHYDETNKHGDLIGIFLQGSQNYIDDSFLESSDIDSFAIYMPSKREVCLAKDISRPDLSLENGEIITRKDVRSFIGLLRKPSISNFEILFTEYYYINEEYQDFYESLVDIRERIVRHDKKKFLMSVMGISLQETKRLTKMLLWQEEDIKTYGYSRKTLANILRYELVSSMYISGAPFTSCLKAMDQELIKKIRTEKTYELAEAIELAKTTNEQTFRNAKRFAETSDNSVLGELEDILVDLLSRQFE